MMQANITNITNMKIIYDKRTQDLIYDLSKMLDLADDYFDEMYDGDPGYRFTAFHKDPTRNEILDEIKRIKSIAIPLGYECDLIDYKLINK